MKIKNYLLETTNFIAGALGMIIELVAARILSPYLGSSNLIWTCIIGIMLAFMSIGYYLGGKISDKIPKRNVLSIFILSASFFIALIPLIETEIVKPLSEYSNKINPNLIAIICSCVTFGPASLLLATVSPFAVKLKEKEIDDIGKISGRMSACSTIGSIVGTFLAGFILIPSIGVTNIILLTTITTAILSFIVFEEKNIKTILSRIILLAITIGVVYLGKYNFLQKNPTIILDTDSEYSRIWVRKIQNNQNQELYVLEAEKGYESIMHEKEGLYSDYMNYYNLFDTYQESTENVLMIGGAAYIYPSYFLKEYQDKNIDVVEIDSKMTKIAEEYFSLDRNNPRLSIYHQDGRTYLNNNKSKKYDCILVDAFKGINPPFQLTTYEATKKASENLNDGGIIISNIASALTGENAKFIEYEYSTYKAVFDDVKVFRAQPGLFNDDEIQNLILIGKKNGTLEIENEENQNLVRLLENEITDYKSDKPIATDDYCPIGV